MRVGLTLNGAPRTVDCAPGETLLSLLRRTGCASVRCGGTGSAAVLLDGRLVSAEVLLAAQAHGHEVTTAESIEAPP